MRVILCLFVLCTLSSCSKEDIIEITQSIKETESTGGTSSGTKFTAKVTNVSINGNQLSITGENLDEVAQIKMSSTSGFQETFQIASKTSSNIIVDVMNNISFDISDLFSLIISNSYGSTTYQVTFVLQDGSVTASKLSNMGAGDGDVLSYNQSLNQWEPRALSGLSYIGTWDARTLGEGGSENAPSASPSVGDFWVVSLAGSTDLDGINIWNAGDWAIYNGTNWEKISSANGVLSFNGREGAVVPQAGDYTWADIDKTNAYIGDLSNVDTTGVAAGKILKFDGSKWIISDDLTAASGSGDFKADGSVSMSGALNMGAQNITNVGTVDGVDVSALNSSILSATNDIAINATNIASNSASIASATNDIATNATNIASNSASIASATNDIATNATNIASNSASIASAGDFKADGTIAMSGNLDVGNHQLKLKSDNTQYVTLAAPSSLAATYNLIFPVDDGAAGQILSTDGAGNLSWISAGGAGDITDVSAGAGLTGGASSGAAGLDIGAGTGIVVNADDVAVDVGTTNGKIAQVGVGDKLPISIIPGLGVETLTSSSGNYLTYKPNNIACNSGEILELNGSGQWICGGKTVDTDTDTTYTAGTGLELSGTSFAVKAQGLLDTHLSGVSSSCSNGQILLTNGLGAFYCSDITTIQGRSIASAAPTNGQVLAWNSSTSKWEPANAGSADNLGNHTATANIQLGSNYLSGDGDNEGIVVDSTGKVGVGTATPGSALEVNGMVHSTLGGFKLPDGTVVDEAADLGGGGGSVNWSFSSQSSNFTASTTNHVFYQVSGSATSVTLPSAASVGANFQLKILNLTSSNLVINPDGSESINSRIMANIKERNALLTLISDGSNWLSFDFSGDVIFGCTAGSVIFNATGTLQTFTVPTGCTQLTIKAWGAGGGGTIYNYSGEGGGDGGYATGIISSLSGGETFNIVVGEGGIANDNGSIAAYGGGGLSGGNNTYGEGGGGGYSGVFSGAVSQANALIIAGAGGGGHKGGDGGGVTGNPTAESCGTPATGGTQSAGGTGGIASSGTGADGSALQGGTGGLTSGTYSGGGGGGGYYGGGGGGHTTTSCLGGGGGGSSYIGGVSSAQTITGLYSSDADYVTGVSVGGNNGGGNGGDGLIVIYYE